MNGANEAIRLETISFAARLQAKYPFVFEPGTWGVSGDMNRRKQERLLTHFILRSIISSHPLPDRSRPAALRLAARIVKQIGPGGGQFCAPRILRSREKARTGGRRGRSNRPSRAGAGNRQPVWSDASSGQLGRTHHLLEPAIHGTTAQSRCLGIEKPLNQSPFGGHVRGIFAVPGGAVALGPVVECLLGGSNVLRIHPPDF